MFEHRGGMASGLRRTIIVGGCVLLTGSGVPAADADEPGDEGDSRFPDTPVPLRLHDFPARPKPILELGAPFLGTGVLDRGIDMPGGSTWQPSVLVFGTLRTAIQTFDNGTRESTEWANRLDLFANLQLTGTERVLIGVRPFDQDERFTGYTFEPNSRDGWDDALNARITTLFFEGDFGEMFPDLDPTDTGLLDWGIAVGRQPIFFQQGLLINDQIDGVALVRDTLIPPGGSDLKLTFFYGFDDIHRDDNDEEGGTDMLALFTEADYRKSTWNVDLIYVAGDGMAGGDGFYWGISATQRLGQINTAFRLVGSEALDTENAKVSSGQLLFAEVSWTPHHTEDTVYINGFWGIDEFASAARDPQAGGPLGETGLLFAAVGLGQYGAALGNRADNAAGVAIGYQHLFDETRKQLNFEIGGRTSTNSVEQGLLAVGGNYQQAIGKHTIFRVDSFVSFPDGGQEGYGARMELLFKF